MSTFSWTCPFCGRPTTVTGSDYSENIDEFILKNKYGSKKLHIRWIVCPNPECKEYTLSLQLYDYHYRAGDNATERLIKAWNLIPPAQSKVFPDYVPYPIKNDYLEACMIRDLSPKASATLARRCLQGIIRDFWGVKGKNLKQEIEAIKTKVDPLTWKAIDSVRNVGNIGAHMEKDINLIIDVEPNEASLLINLIETVIKEWYVHKNERERMLTDIVKMSKQKDTKKKGSDIKLPTPK